MPAVPGQRTRAPGRLSQPSVPVAGQGSPEKGQFRGPGEEEEEALPSLDSGPRRQRGSGAAFRSAGKKLAALLLCRAGSARLSPAQAVGTLLS